MKIAIALAFCHALDVDPSDAAVGSAMAFAKLAAFLGVA